MEAPATSEVGYWNNLTTPSMRRTKSNPGRNERDYTYLLWRFDYGGCSPVPGVGRYVGWISGKLLHYMRRTFPIDQFIWNDTQEKIVRVLRFIPEHGASLAESDCLKDGDVRLDSSPFSVWSSLFFVVNNGWCIPVGLLSALIVNA